MSGIKYVCLDDEKSATQSIINAVNGIDKNFHILPEEPKPFEEQVKNLKASASKQLFDGLIIDLRLDQTKLSDNTVLGYRAVSLAQALRNIATEQPSIAFPIVLWSTDNKLEHYFNRDVSSHDLFDKVYDKAEVPDNAASIVGELISLSKGYRSIRKSRRNGLLSILSVPLLVSRSWDPRIIADIEPKDSRPSIDAYARFILKQLIQRPGVLIDEETLAAILGIDLKASEDWVKLLEKLPGDAKYEGPFCESWPRWWSQVISHWLGGLKGDVMPFNQLLAVERVKILNKALKLKQLRAATGIEPSYSSKFSTICIATHRPLDPIDGFLVAGSMIRPWQGRHYVSKAAALKPARYQFHASIDPLEKERLDSLKTVKHGAKK